MSNDFHEILQITLIKLCLTLKNILMTRYLLLQLSGGYFASMKTLTGNLEVDHLLFYRKQSSQQTNLVNYVMLYYNR